jgi:hypothetical protein
VRDLDLTNTKQTLQILGYYEMRKRLGSVTRGFSLSCDAGTIRVWPPALIEKVIINDNKILGYYEMRKRLGMS